MLGAILAAVTYYPNISDAKSPVVIELFGRNSCDDDQIFQKKLQNILQTEEDIILINCRINYDDDKSDKSFTLQFCTDKKKMYEKEFRKYGFSTAVPLILNGRWEGSYYNDIYPAINLARTDNIETILINIHDDIINISIPEIESNEKYGKIFLYIYASTIDNKNIFANSAIELISQEKSKKRNNLSFATKTGTAPFYLRPVLAAEQIGQWNGEKMNITLSLDKIASLKKASYADLSYIVVLHEGNVAGSILAAGEAMSLKEMRNSVSHNEFTDKM